MSVIRRFWRPMLAVAALCAVIVFGLSYLQPTRFQASTEMIMSDPRAAGVFPEENQPPLDDFNRYLLSQAEIVVSRSTLEAVSAAVGGRLGVDELLKRVKAAAVLESGTIRITAIDSTPEGAKELADLTAAAYQDAVVERVSADTAALLEEAHAARDEVAARIAALDEALAVNPSDPALVSERFAATSELLSDDARIQAIPRKATLFGSGVQSVEQASVPEGPIQPRQTRNALVAGVLGLLAAGIHFTWRNQVSPGMDDRRDPASILSAPLLGVVSSRQRGGVGRATADLAAGVADDYRGAAAALERAAAERSARVVLVTTALAGGAKTAAARRLAFALARSERRTVLVDADLSDRRLSRGLRLAEAPGITDLGRGSPWADCTTPTQVGSASLMVVPAGAVPAAGAGFFGSAEGRRALASLRDQADLAILDGPAMAASPEALLLAGEADGLVFIVARGEDLGALEEAAERAAAAKAVVLGYLFDRARWRRL
jgi:Mrp family chromosome partitioning ATPase/capsular polysaccharide biosynthesis protein